jgi:RND family efflux transporter MFP subunit
MVGVSGDTKLATLDKLIPIYVYFNLNERDALSIRQTMRKLGIEPGEVVGTVPVLVGLQDEDQFPHQGILNFVDSGASTSTGTVQLRAELNNEDLVLFPGLFARVRIPLGDPQTLPVLPGMAVGNDQQGDYVMMVNAQDVVERRSVIKGQMTPTGQAIQSGITSADRVIVRGLMSVRQGDKVRTQTDASADATAPANPVAPINQPDS